MDFWSKLYNLMPHPAHGYIHNGLAKLSELTGIGWVKFVPPVTVPVLAFLVVVLVILMSSANLRQKATP